MAFRAAARYALSATSALAISAPLAANPPSKVNGRKIGVSATRKPTGDPHLLSNVERSTSYWDERNR
jgi:hypothetical protein